MSVLSPATQVLVWVFLITAGSTLTGQLYLIFVGPTLAPAARFGRDVREGLLNVVEWVIYGRSA